MTDKSGSAFPVSGGYRGMSLRDWFAGQALAGNVAALSSDSYFMTLVKMATDNGMTMSQALATSSYAYADAMIAEREKEENDGGC